MLKPKKFRKPRLLISGCGDIGMRCLKLLQHRYRIFALTSQVQHYQKLRDAGGIPILGNLDNRHSLKRLTGLATRIFHFAPPQKEGVDDKRTRRLITILSANKKIKRTDAIVTDSLIKNNSNTKKLKLVYMSTSGVYGDYRGQLVQETSKLMPLTDRAKRRFAAERMLRKWSGLSARKKHGTKKRISILRVPGIYSKDRLPIERVKQGLPALVQQEDVYTNHIHADDLALLAITCLYKSKPSRAYNVADDSCIKAADYFDLVADTHFLPRPPRLSMDQLKKHLSPMQLSFLLESRVLSNRRQKNELQYTLLYPYVEQGIFY